MGERSMELNFNLKEVNELINFQRINGHSLKKPYAKYLPEGEDKTCPPSLLLVGDQGVYLMNHSEKTMPRKNGKGKKEGWSQVVFAEECNPHKLDFDEWRYNKEDSFGGDDGCEIYPIRNLEIMCEDYYNKKGLPKKGYEDFFTIELSPKRFYLKGIKRRKK